MGSGQGLADKLGRGGRCGFILAALSTTRPRAFLMENVTGLVAQQRATFDYMLKQLRKSGKVLTKLGTQSSTPHNMASRNAERVSTSWVCSATARC
ncbi:MAG: DNA cytosine methyltransferase, partial [Candidatus Fonsibacter sp.]